MITKLFSIYDSKAQVYMFPFQAQNKGSAIRSFDDACNENGTAFNKHPEDFTLFEIGTFDDNICHLNTLEHYEPLGKALEFIKKTPIM